MDLSLNENLLLHDEQKRAVSKMVTARGGLVWWKVGEGKTRIGLFTFARLQNIYQWSLPSICLVICRRRAFYDWRSEIKTCFPRALVFEDYSPIHPPSSEPCFLLVSHAELVKRYDQLQGCKSIRFCILDELWLYANKKVKRSKNIYKITMGRKAVGLSGTVMKARSIDEIYCQAMAVQKHRYLAPSLTKFRSITQKTQWINGAFPKTTAKKGAYRKIMLALEDCSDVHFPKGTRLINEQYHTVPSTAEQRELFHELRNLYSAEKFGLEFNHAVVIGIKAQQIANGWIEDSKGKIQSITSLKIEKLEDEVADIVASGQQVIVWCAFRYDVKMLAARSKFACLQMLGGEDFDIDSWNTGNFNVCFATEASGSSVNYFRNTPYAIYFSADHKWINMQQSRGRTDRKDSKHPECFYKYLQVEDSLDAKVFKTAMESGSAESRLILQAGVQDWLKL